MSTYKSFAVVGGGKLGMPIVKALAAQNVAVVLLSRSGLDAARAESFPAGVKVATVDTADAAAVATVFEEHKVEVVISTVTTAAVGTQTVLVDAAKSAGVKLFAPSEFGMSTEGDVNNPKNKIIEYIKNVGIPYARFFNGMITEFLPMLIGIKEHGKIILVGKGDAPVSFTSMSDITGFVAYVLTTLPPRELENRTFRLQGDRVTMNELGAIFNTEVEHTDKIAGPMGGFITMMLLLTDTGVGSTGWDAEKKAEKSGSEAAGSANALWPGHHWKSIKEALHF
ncbi:NmrA domain-containing protein [Mycena venus]|uniref:NmrA domain-containing protein n=1 Tax=Mycena venus TaxID=2733690 RepID=A0A8H6WUL2_9AGAR|nr:NmrA domain-containing protein [Mycena venus]